MVSVPVAASSSGSRALIGTSSAPCQYSGVRAGVLTVVVFLLDDENVREGRQTRLADADEIQITVDSAEVRLQHLQQGDEIPFAEVEIGHDRLGVDALCQVAGAHPR